MERQGLEVGQEIQINGRTYWISEIGVDRIGLMRNPDCNGKVERRAKPESYFWRTFFCILLAVILIKLVF